jgi:hypothetical protein
MSDNKFAAITWPSRWNSAAAAAALSQAGADVMAVGFFGTVRFRLDDPESVTAIVNHARRFADMVEQAGLDYRLANVGGQLPPLEL